METSPKHINVVDVEASTKHIDKVTQEKYPQGPDGTPLKVSPEGIPLEPQPTDDPADPLNWPARRKRQILFVIVFCSFFADYAAAGGAVAIPAQAVEWHKTASEAYTPTAANTMLLGVGGIISVVISAYAGRLPTLFWFMLCTAGTAAWCAAANTYGSYLGARVSNGFFVNVAEAGGLMWIKDIFFAHERPQAVNVWVCALILSPFLGPCISAGIMSTTSWHIAMWVNFACVTLAVLFIVVLAEEPFYPRHQSPKDIPKIYQMPKWSRLVGWAQLRTRYTTNSMMESVIRAFKICTKPVALLVYVFYFFDYGWIVANNTTMAVVALPEYNFGYGQLAALYVAPLIGGLLGFGCGHVLFPLIDRVLSLRTRGDLEPERRLIAVWIVLPIQTLGYNLIGCSFEHRWSYWVVAIGWAMHTFAIIVTTTALADYVADVYPKASGESSALLNLARTTSGFLLGYVQIPWETKLGPQLQYGIGSVIFVASAFLFLAPVHIFGKRMRDWAGPLHIKTG